MHRRACTHSQQHSEMCDTIQLTHYLTHSTLTLTPPSHSLLHLHILHSPDQLQSAGRQVFFEFGLVQHLDTCPQHTRRIVPDDLQSTHNSINTLNTHTYYNTLYTTRSCRDDTHKLYYKHARMHAHVAIPPFTLTTTTKYNSNLINNRPQNPHSIQTHFSTPH